MNKRREAVLVVDFGTQYCQLIARRVREEGVYCEITVPSGVEKDLERLDPSGIVLSGGPASVYDRGAPEIPASVLERGVPVLGICYGMQWMARTLGGEVARGERGGEYGHTEIRVIRPEDPLLAGVPERTVVWMSHGDRVEKLPPGFQVLASSGPCPVAVMGDRKRRFYGLQFHPEVAHTAEGKTILRNFLRGVCGLVEEWRPGDFVEESVARIREQVGGDGEVLLGLSGGVDSSVAALLLQRAIGDRLHCVFVDNGLLRKGEARSVEETFRGRFQMDLHVVDAADRFLAKLAGVVDPERKRKIIGGEFVEVFREKAGEFRTCRFLGQGTLYPDVIESVAAHGGPTATIKTHHNVGGLPEDLEMELVEPLRELFKDEVREVGRVLGLPEALVARQPFPGPGLAVRCLGEVTRERLAVLREADAIVTEEIEKAGLAGGLWQYFAVLLPVRSVGVMGDRRTYEEALAVRAVESEDAMTADWAYLPRDVLRRISNRIINEVQGVNRVVLDISSKPPSTIEWE